MYFEFYFGKNCNVCHSMEPKIKNISEKYNIPFFKIDTEEEMEKSSQKLIFSIPALLLYDDDGKEMNRWVRIFSLSALENFLKRIL